MHAQQPVEIKTFQSKNNKVGAGWGWQRRLFSLQLEKGTKHRPIATACSSRVVPLSAGWAGVSQIAQVEQAGGTQRYLRWLLTFVVQITSAVNTENLCSSFP